MPQRTNARQAIVYILRKHTAEPETTVRESALLRDAVTGHTKEVDVVLDTRADGEPITISIEVVARKRPAGRPWVEEMIKKHDRLPTNRLMLVSWSGFTSSAKEAAAAEGGRVVTITPEQIEADGIPLCERLRGFAVAYGWPDRVFFWASIGDQRTLFNMQLGAPILDQAGAAVANCAEVAWELLQRDGLNEDVDAALRVHGLGVDGAAYTINRVQLEKDGWFLSIDGEELYLIDQATIQGTLHVAICDVDLWLTQLGGRIFRAGEAPFQDRQAVWICVPDRATGESRVVFRDL